MLTFTKNVKTSEKIGGAPSFPGKSTLEYRNTPLAEPTPGERGDINPPPTQEPPLWEFPPSDRCFPKRVYRIYGLSPAPLPWHFAREPRDRR